ncbi:GNAT family N-acetyltransferase [Burkholderia cepacia]
MTSKVKVIYDGDLEQIKEYSEAVGFDKNDAQNILDRACTKGEIEIAKFAIEKGADIDPPGGNPLRLASYYGHTEVVKDLLQRGADPQPDGNAALQYAAGQGHLDVVKLLLDAGADHSFGEPFMWAVRNNRLDVVKHFIQKTDIDFVKDSDRAQRIAQQHEFKEMADYLEGLDFYFGAIMGEERDRRANHERLIARDLPRLRKAATENNVDLANQLLRDRADFQMEDNIALRVAAERGNNEVMTFFLEHGGADVHALTDAALCGAAKNGHLDCVKTLVKHGADIHALSSFPLLIAAHRGHTDIVRYFIEDLNMEVSRGGMSKMKQNGCFQALEIIHQREKKNQQAQLDTVNQQPVNLQSTVNQSIARAIAEPGTSEAFAFYGRETAKQVSPELKIAKGDHTHRYIAYEDGKPVSGIVVALKNELFNLKENTITTAYTDPEYQQRGIATSLLKQVQKDFKNKLVVSPDLTEKGVKLFKPKQALTR